MAMRVGKRREIAVWAMVFGGLASASAQAQTASQPITSGAIQLPTVTVGGTAETATGPVDGYVANRTATGTKSDTPLVETSQSISVITRDLMWDQKVQGLNETLRYTAGVTPETRGAVATRYDLLKIRGFDPNYYWNGLKLQDLYYATPQIDTYLMERVEVLKGPSSVLYGQAAAGGLINLTSKLPTATPLHEVGLEYGSNNHFRAVSDFSGPMDAAGKYLYRFTAVGLSEDGQIDHTQNQRISAAPSFTWKPDGDTTLSIVALYQRDPKASSYGGIPPQGTVLPNPRGTISTSFYDGDPNFEKFERNSTSLGYQFEKHLNETWTTRVNGRWLQTDVAYDSIYANGLQADNRTLNRGIATSRESLTSYTFDNQAEAKFTTGPLKHTTLFGFDHQRVRGDYSAGFGTAPTLDVFSPVYYLTNITPPAVTRTDIMGTQTGLYAQDQIKLGGFVLSLAGRQDWANQKSRTITSTTHKEDSAFTKKAGLLYLFENGIAPYVSYSESFTPQTGTTFAGKPYDPEEGEQYEVGVKYQPTFMPALFSAAVYDLTRSNLLTGDPSHPGYSVQSGEARSRGVEFEAKAAVTEQLSVTAAYSYTDTLWIKNNDGNKDKRLPAVPHHQASAWARYKVDQGKLDGVGAGVGVRYTGSSVNDANTFKVPAVTLLDLALSYDLGKVSTYLAGAEASINVKNLTDEEYVASCYYGSWCAYGYRRTVLGNLTYRW